MEDRIRIHPLKCALGSGMELVGRSRAADSTAFFVPQLSLALDGGCVISSAKPATVLLTHTHADHCFRVTHLTSRQKPPAIVVPLALVPFVDSFIKAGVTLSGCSLDAPQQFDHNCDLLGVKPGDRVALKGKPGFHARVYEMTHSVPCVGYGIVKTTSKLKPEFRSLSGPEIAALRKDRDVVVMHEQEEPLFVFCGDTTSEVFRLNPGLLLFPVIIIECSFLFESEREKAESSKHMLWPELKPIVLAHPHVRFILIHFSMRYKKKEIRDFFSREALPNVEVMLQDEKMRPKSTAHSVPTPEVLKRSAEDPAISRT
jgi:ribonuclease Z